MAPGVALARLDRGLCKLLPAKCFDTLGDLTKIEVLLNAAAAVPHHPSGDALIAS